MPFGACRPTAEVLNKRPEGQIRPARGREMAREDTETANNLFSNAYEIFLTVLFSAYITLLMK